MAAKTPENASQIAPKKEPKKAPKKEPGMKSEFFQNAPKITGVNTYENDRLLQAFLSWRMSPEALRIAAPDLQRFGGRCGGDIRSFGERAETEEPRHFAFDPWGRRIDRIEVSSGWLALDRVAAEEGLVAIGYERKIGEFSRLHQFSKLYLFHIPSAFYTCPLAMTDGAARAIELYGTPEIKDVAFSHLTSRDPAQFWTSGQWMTEKTGGSDVSGTLTVARPDEEEKGKYRLYGDKWFTSATTSQMALALAKVDGATDSRDGLSLFFVQLRDASGKLCNIRIERLKDKLGTRALPTAELTLDGVPAELIGGIGEGVKRVASMLNITRLYNSVTALGTMSHAIFMAKEYAKQRVAFGRLLAEHPLHLQTLADMQTDTFKMNVELRGLVV